LGTPWSIQVLTPDHLVGGLCDERDTDGAAYFLRPWADMDGKIGLAATMHLTSAESRPTRRPGEASRFAEWLSLSQQIVAVIPRDELSIQHVARNVGSKHVTAGEIFAGPYRVAGTLHLSDRKLSALRFQFNVAVADAEISWLMADGSGQTIQAPWALIRTHLIQGVGVGG
jgi:hypothetical protein